MGLRQPKQDPFASLNVDEKKVLQSAMQGQDVQDDTIMPILQKLSPDVKKGLMEEAQSLRTVEDDRESFERMQEEGTITGTLKDVGRSVLRKAVDVGEFVDVATGAQATRKAIFKGVGGEIPEGPEAFDPTGKDIAAQLGASTEDTLEVPFTDFKFSPAGAAGLFIDIAADPTNIIPIGTILKGIGRGAKAAVKGTGRLAAKTSVEVVEKVSPRSREIINEFIEHAKPERAPDFPRMKKIAEKKNFTITDQTEFGAESAIGRRKIGLAETGTGEGQKIKQQILTARDEVLDDLKNTVENLTGSREGLGKIQAGELIRKNWDKHKKELFDSMDFRYSNLYSQHPGMNMGDVSPKELLEFEEYLDDVAAKFGDLLEFSTDPNVTQQAKVTMNAINKMAASGGDFKTFIKQIQQIGRDAFEGGFKKEIPADKATLRDIYFKGTDLIKDVTEASMGKGVRDALEANNKQIVEFLKDKKLIETLTDPNVANETVFDKLIKRGDSLQIDVVRRMMDPDDYYKVAGEYLNAHIFDSDKIGTISNKIKNEKLRLAEIFKTNPEILKDVQDVVDYGKTIGPTQLGPSTPIRSFLTEALHKVKGVSIDKIDMEVIEGLKKVARGEDLPPMTAAQEKEVLSIFEKIKKGGEDVAGLRRGGIGRALKAAQVAGVQHENVGSPVELQTRR